ncbi:hypothetical protein JKP88DRAFT_206664 [Tribonema minus]|uniref:HECT domain-containing protein n=1 Tax=Tribonema minus TaxID=303371 RepID=A0A835Z7D6_9STRA|nr:hypothetical protein JKP88DRAFT_206664 [Tribonema minus]
MWHGDAALPAAAAVAEAQPAEQARYLHRAEGLYPRPVPPARAAEMASRFRSLGRLIGKALKDGRALDLPLALPLCAWLTGRATFSAAADVALIDASLSRSLAVIVDLGARFAAAPRGAAGASARAAAEAEAEALCLNWTLPGYPWYELRPGGAAAAVAAGDAAAYAAAVAEHLLVRGVAAQLRDVERGVAEVLGAGALRVFAPRELQAMLGGGGGGGGAAEHWRTGAIAGAVVCRHGYTAESSQVAALVEVLSELDAAQRRAFLSFVTGSPRLPLGGFAALQPRLTVVRKDTPRPDEHLPSCSTCQVYLKLPAYTCKAVLRAKLLQAINEGREHFALD